MMMVMVMAMAMAMAMAMTMTMTMTMTMMMMMMCELRKSMIEYFQDSPASLFNTMKIRRERDKHFKQFKCFEYRSIVYCK